MKFLTLVVAFGVYTILACTTGQIASKKSVSLVDYGERMLRKTKSNVWSDCVDQFWICRLGCTFGMWRPEHLAWVDQAVIVSSSWYVHPGLDSLVRRPLATCCFHERQTDRQTDTKVFFTSYLIQHLWYVHVYPKNSLCYERHILKACAYEYVRYPATVISYEIWNNISVYSRGGYCWFELFCILTSWVPFIYALIISHWNHCKTRLVAYSTNRRQAISLFEHERLNMC